MMWHSGLIHEEVVAGCELDNFHPQLTELSPIAYPVEPQMCWDYPANSAFLHAKLPHTPCHSRHTKTRVRLDLINCWWNTSHGNTNVKKGHTRPDNTKWLDYQFSGKVVGDFQNVIPVNNCCMLCRLIQSRFHVLLKFAIKGDHLLICNFYLWQCRNVDQCH